MITKFAIFGNGGFAKEVKSLILQENNPDSVEFFDIIDDEKYNPNLHGLPIIAIGNPNIRKKIVTFLNDRFPTLEFPNLINKNVSIGQNVTMGRGIIITQNCVLTTDIHVGNFCHLNLSTTIGHDVILGDYFTTAPGVHVNGNVKIKECVYMGSNSCTVEKINICENVIVGAGAVIAKSIDETGTYVGVPAKKIK